MFKKYFFIAKQTWDETMVYRLNFVMWRIRNMLLLISTYFLWLAVVPQGEETFGYTQSLILTYILVTSFLSSVVMSSRSGDVGAQINSGDLSNILVRPLNIYKTWFARDLGDKAVNIAFAVVEFIFFLIILHPPFFVQTNILFWLLFILAVSNAILLNFFFNLLLGAIGFWSPEVWGPRFIFFILMTFFAGSLFPLDIVPQPFLSILQNSPFSYLLYFPAKIYLGQLSLHETLFVIVRGVVWVGIMYFCTILIWRKGLSSYAAQGR